MNSVRTEAPLHLTSLHYKLITCIAISVYPVYPVIFLKLRAECLLASLSQMSPQPHPGSPEVLAVLWSLKTVQRSECPELSWFPKPKVHVPAFHLHSLNAVINVFLKVRRLLFFINPNSVNACPNKPLTAVSEQKQIWEICRCPAVISIQRRPSSLD